MKLDCRWSSGDRAMLGSHERARVWHSVHGVADEIDVRFVDERNGKTKWLTMTREEATRLAMRSLGTIVSR